MLPLGMRIKSRKFVIKRICMIFYSKFIQMINIGWFCWLVTPIYFIVVLNYKNKNKLNLISYQMQNIVYHNIVSLFFFINDPWNLFNLIHRFFFLFVHLTSLLFGNMFCVLLWLLRLGHLALEKKNCRSIDA